MERAKQVVGRHKSIVSFVEYDIVCEGNKAIVRHEIDFEEAPRVVARAGF